MNKSNVFFKRLFDLTFSFAGLILTSPIILICLLLSRVDTGKSGLFRQNRIGKNGRHFKILKARTMKDDDYNHSTISTSSDPRITNLGSLFRKTKLDELPQLWNVLIGKMSFVGPRPDVPGYADKLTGNDSKILKLRPGITGPASFHFRNEEKILGRKDDPKWYNDHVIWPQKVKINLDYYHNYSLAYDLKLIVSTISPFFRKSVKRRIDLILKLDEE